METLSEKSIVIEVTDKGIYKLLTKYCYEIIVEKRGDESHSINISHPAYHTTAFCDAEAVGKMMLSEFEYKYSPIYKINKF